MQLNQPGPAPWALRAVRALHGAAVVLDAAIKLVERLSMLVLASLALGMLIVHSMP